MLVPILATESVSQEEKETLEVSDNKLPDLWSFTLQLLWSQMYVYLWVKTDTSGITIY